VREEAVRDAQRILADTAARHQEGLAEREAVLRAEVELTQSQQFLLVARQAVRDAQATLNVEMGRPAQVPLRIAEIEVQPAFKDTLEGCLGWAAINRREILIAREAVAEAEGGVQAARGDLLPKVYVRGVVLRADSSGPLNTFIEGIGIHAEQAIYDGGRYRGELRRSEAQVSSAFAGLKSITDNVSLQVSLAFEAIDTDLQRIELGRTSVRQARENLRLTRVRYDKGTATPTDIVDAQTALVQAETNYYTAIYGYLEALAQLDYAVGGDQSHLLLQLQPQLEAAP
jgi:outer membrane protein TolC